MHQAEHMPADTGLEMINPEIGLKSGQQQRNLETPGIWKLSIGINRNLWKLTGINWKLGNIKYSW